VSNNSRVAIAMLIAISRIDKAGRDKKGKPSDQSPIGPGAGADPVVKADCPADIQPIQNRFQ